MQRNAEFLTAGMRGISTFYFFSLSVVSSGIICCRVTNPSTLALTRNVYQGFPSRSLHGCFFFHHLPCKKKKKEDFSFYSPGSIFPGHTTSSGACRITQDGISDFPSLLSTFHCLAAWIGYPNLRANTTNKIPLSHNALPRHRIPPGSYSGLVIDKHQAKEGSLG